MFIIKGMKIHGCSTFFVLKYATNSEMPSNQNEKISFLKKNDSLVLVCVKEECVFFRSICVVSCGDFRASFLFLKKNAHLQIQFKKSQSQYQLN